MAKPRPAPFTVEELKRWLHYDPLTGDFTWLKKASSRAMPGYQAGCLDKINGYWVITVMKTYCRRGRLAWLYMTGEWPEAEVDHKNLVKNDDRWDNLRPGDRSQQLTNQRPRANHLRGIYQRKSGRWMAQIRKHDVRLTLGTFDTQEEAHEAYKAAALRMHGEYARFE